MVHVYWIECENELNIVHSNTGAASLPSKTSVTVTDKCKVSVTQLKSDKNNGMGYVIQLTDGSFIIYDGGYGTACAEELWSALVELNGGSEQGIVIRTWLITHSHIDHFTCFDLFSDSYADKVTLETVMISPLNQTDAYNNDTTKSEYKYLSIDIYSDLEKYEGVNLLFVHTGMQFTYGDVKMEILFTADELYITEPEEIAANFNNTSIISRIYNDNGSCLFLGDAGASEAYRLIAYYGDYLKSDMCQVAHHGVEDFPLIAYRYIQAETLWYPCDKALYNRSDRDADVRKALRESQYTKEIIVRDKTRVTRYI